MKKIFLVFLMILCATSGCITTVVAASPADVATIDTTSLGESSASVEYFEDGSYLVTTIQSTPTPRASVYTKNGTKEVTLYNSSDEVQWIYYLVGTFTVETGVSSVCTNSTFSYTIYDNSWSLTDHSNSYSGNAAYGTAVFKRKVLFITTSTQNIDARVMCDVNGVIS